MATGAGREFEEGRRSNSHGSASQHPTRRPDKEPLRYIRQRLDDASKKQEDLVQSREDLLLQRQQVRTYGNQVREQRIQAGNAEISFMNQLRQYCNEHGLEFPSNLDATYQTVQKERDKLGSIEAEYLQAERVLGGREFTFLEEETEFYQYELVDMFADDFLENLSAPAKSEVDVESQPRPSADPDPDLNFPPGDIETDYHAAVSELEQLRKEFDILRMRQSNYIQNSKRSNASLRKALSEPQQDPEFEKEYIALLTKIADSEVRVQQLKQDFHHFEDLKFEAIQRRFSDPVHGVKEPVSHSDTIRRALTESAIPTLRDNFAGSKARIRGWIWEHLRSSGLEKARYKTILAHVGHPEDDAWEGQASQYWDDDSDKSPNSPEGRFHDPSITHYTSQRSNMNLATGSHEVEYSPLQEAHRNPKRVKFTMNFEDSFNYAPIPSEESMDSLELVEPSDLPQGVAPPQPLPPPSLPENVPLESDTMVAKSRLKHLKDRFNCALTPSEHYPPTPSKKSISLEPPEPLDLLLSPSQLQSHIEAPPIATEPQLNPPNHESSSSNIQYPDLKRYMPTNRPFKLGHGNDSHASMPPFNTHTPSKHEGMDIPLQTAPQGLQPPPDLSRRGSATDSDYSIYSPSTSATVGSDSEELVRGRPYRSHEYVSNTTPTALSPNYLLPIESKLDEPPSSPTIILSKPSTPQDLTQDSSTPCPTITTNIKEDFYQMLCRMSCLAPSSALNNNRAKSERSARSRSSESVSHRRTSSSSGSLSIHDTTNHGKNNTPRPNQSTEQKEMLLQMKDQVQRRHSKAM